ncbi:hypothetical protein THAOC_20273, partial [Thalassiosira oceanica]
MDAPESPEVQDDAIDAAMAGRFDTWVKDEVRIEALREAAEGRHRGSWVHQRAMTEMPPSTTISSEACQLMRMMRMEWWSARSMSLTRRATTTSTSTESINVIPDGSQ